ncbi:hypothetical protein AB1Y20_010326 [Prymnesium parvum]|uniref:EF-hand domain-containing protein n=1 Tax=Prymnesium parvum TaxID=97485 RepID=A0AB34K424_PRYPA
MPRSSTARNDARSGRAQLPPDDVSAPPSAPHPPPHRPTAPRLASSARPERRTLPPRTLSPPLASHPSPPPPTPASRPRWLVPRDLVPLLPAGFTGAAAEGDDFRWKAAAHSPHAAAYARRAAEHASARRLAETARAGGERGSGAVWTHVLVPALTWLCGCVEWQELPTDSMLSMLEAEHHSALDATIEQVAHALLEGRGRTLLVPLWRSLTHVIAKSVRTSWRLMHQLAAERQAHRHADAARVAQVLSSPPHPHQREGLSPLRFHSPSPLSTRASVSHFTTATPSTLCNSTLLELLPRPTPHPPRVQKELIDQQGGELVTQHSSTNHSSQRLTSRSSTSQLAKRGSACLLSKRGSACQLSTRGSTSQLTARGSLRDFRQGDSTMQRLHLSPGGRELHDTLEAEGEEEGEDDAPAISLEDFEEERKRRVGLEKQLLELRISKEAIEDSYNRAKEMWLLEEAREAPPALGTRPSVVRRRSISFIEEGILMHEKKRRWFLERLRAQMIHLKGEVFVRSVEQDVAGSAEGLTAEACTQYDEADLLVLDSRRQSAIEKEPEPAAQTETRKDSRRSSNARLSLLSANRKLLAVNNFGQISKLRTLKQQEATVRSICEDKLKLDAAEELEGRPPRELRSFVADYFVRKHGLKQVADKHLNSLMDGLSQLDSLQPGELRGATRLRVFAAALGVLPLEHNSSPGQHSPLPTPHLPPHPPHQHTPFRSSHGYEIVSEPVALTWFIEFERKVSRYCAPSAGSEKKKELESFKRKALGGEAETQYIHLDRAVELLRAEFKFAMPQDIARVVSELEEVVVINGLPKESDSKDDHRFSPHQILRGVHRRGMTLRDAFALLDMDGSGELEMEEFTTGIVREFDSQLTSAQVERLMDLTDEDNSGTISFNELTRALKKTDTYLEAESFLLKCVHFFVFEITSVEEAEGISRNMVRDAIQQVDSELGNVEAHRLHRAMLSRGEKPDMPVGMETALNVLVSSGINSLSFAYFKGEKSSSQEDLTASLLKVIRTKSGRKKGRSSSKLLKALNL